MSRTAFCEDGLLVVDDVLTAAQFGLLSREVARGDYRWVHTQRWDKAWRLFDGHPLRGESVYFDPQRVFGWKGATYPTSSSVDLLIDAVRRATVERPEIAGVEGVDWIALYLSPWLYPVGSSIAFHRDAGRYSGSFTFFAHTRWGAHWGGELLVARASDWTPGAVDNWMTDDDGVLSIATSIPPRPNRLVLLGEQRPHRITRVDQNAGTNVRASIAGFFLRAP